MNKALLVGINNYPDPENHLSGCVNDVTDMADFLTNKESFSMNDVRLLTDDRATKANIVERLKWLVADVKAGDRLVFLYSGHGAQLATRDKTGEVDKKDEIICPWDFDWTDATSIRDNEFNKIFQTVPIGVSFMWLSDSCHSGGLTREIKPKTKHKSKSKFIAAPADIHWRNVTADTLNVKSNKLVPSDKLNVALISGCQSNQTSADASFNNRNNGAMTYYLLKTLKTASGLKMPLNDLVKQINADLNKAGYTQNPQLEGNKALMKKPFLIA